MCSMDDRLKQQTKKKRNNIDVKRYFCRNFTYFAFNLLSVNCFMERTAVILAATELRTRPNEIGSISKSP